MTNLVFKSIRKCYGYEWEAYKNSASNNFIAICHAFSGSVESETWEGLWEEILIASKGQRKIQKKSKKNR